VPRFENNKADALAKLGALLTLPDEKEIQITIKVICWPQPWIVLMKQKKHMLSWFLKSKKNQNGGSLLLVISNMAF